jgi:hypothetical protein
MHGVHDLLKQKQALGWYSKASADHDAVILDKGKLPFNR